VGNLISPDTLLQFGASLLQKCVCSVCCL